jgi:nitrite reductase (NO-forming)
MQGSMGREFMRARQREIEASAERARLTSEPMTQRGRPRSFGRFIPGASAVRITFGVVWLIDATLKWLPGFRSSFVEQIQGAADGQPAWLHGWFAFWINLLEPRAALFAILVAVIETGIALSLISGFARKTTYILAIGFTVLIWATAEGFGGPYASGASDIGTAVIYAMVFLALLVIEADAEPSRHTIDAWLERRWPSWSRVAEVGNGPAIDSSVHGLERVAVTVEGSEAS